MSRRYEAPRVTFDKNGAMRAIPYMKRNYVKSLQVIYETINSIYNKYSNRLEKDVALKLWDELEEWRLLYNKYKTRKRLPPDLQRRIQSIARHGLPLFNDQGLGENPTQTLKGFQGTLQYNLRHDPAIEPKYPYSHLNSVNAWEYSNGVDFD